MLDSSMQITDSEQEIWDALDLDDLKLEMVSPQEKENPVAQSTSGYTACCWMCDYSSRPNTC